MGQITIEIKGSFPINKADNFSAEFGGHAMAINQAVMFLLRELPGAIRKDHQQHDLGHQPPRSAFGYAGKL